MISSTAPDSASRSDHELLELLKDDDKQAFKELFHKHYKRVYYLSYGTTNNEKLSHQIVHDVFLYIWKERYNHNIESLDVYLFALTSTKIIKVVHSVKYYTVAAGLKTLKGVFLNVKRKFNAEKLYFKQKIANDS